MRNAPDRFEIYRPITSMVDGVGIHSYPLLTTTQGRFSLLDADESADLRDLTQSQNVEASVRIPASVIAYPGDRVKVLPPASGEGTWIVQTVRPNQVHSRLMVGRQQRADDGLELGVVACPASEDVHDLADKLLITVTVLHEKPLSKLGE